MIQSVLSHANPYTKEDKIKYAVQRQWWLVKQQYIEKH